MLDKHMGVFPKYRRGEFAEGPSFHHYYNKSFAVSKEHFDAILKEMTHGIERARAGDPGVVDVRAYTRTGELEVQNLSEVVSYANDPHDRLQSIGISVKPKDESMIAMVRFQDYFPGWSASVVVEGGDEQASLGLFNKLRNSVESTFLWYSFLLTTRFWISLALLTIVAYAVFSLGPPALQKMNIIPAPAEQAISAHSAGDLTVVAATGGVHVPKQWTTKAFELAIVCATGLLLVLVVLPYLFPKGTFLIGGEIRRAASISKLRWGLLTIIILLPAGAILINAY